ncbi:hypothetical protein GALMADRAFT_252686 [Galerina marginata CBS 339.88]|uniref:phosphatidylinositol-3,4,5-trisphosphate 3-phosphatase n=1 Tax=Galerina marginata (strain CBS 339.88) TaxID=685588 RepID=A0A067SNP8_GALM3|nr:hypothetical protein GALMADRAFT_252686 [Galerina marginata CBS 339.88]
MTDYIRRLVSGNKARFKDHDLNLELDLVYVTDQVIIMGYPASGMEGLYRNRREDAIRFLQHRHGKNYWVFNFCPIKENSYGADVFEGRVSRYPFPDHHAPPLAVMPLVAREMRTWLSGSPDRVAVLHCKAGKGRSGTMACAYLLALEDNPTPPKLERNHTAKQWAKMRMENTLETLPPDDEHLETSSTVISPRQSLQHDKTVPSDTEGILDVDSGSPPLPSVSNPEKSFKDALKGVLDLHTARRMKPSEKEDKAKQGVSIPSQRRFLYYWSLLLSHEAPKHLWPIDPPLTPKLDRVLPPFQRSKAPHPKVRLTQLKLRMRETSGVKMSIVKAANLLIEKTNMAKGPTVSPPRAASPAPSTTSAANSKNSTSKEKEKDKASPSQVWASLARYDDGLVDLLEEWEVYTRDPDGHMGKRRHGSEHLPRGESTEEALDQIFTSGKWDRKKMVRSFAHFGAVNGGGTAGANLKVVDDKEGKIYVYTLRPLSDKRWEGLKEDLHKTVASDDDHHKQTLEAIDTNASAVGVSRSEANSMYDVTTAASKIGNSLGLEQGVILDAGREIRVKLYMGQVFMGWLWFIPTFHMPQPPPSISSPSSSNPSSPSPNSPSSLKSTFLLTRKDLDFPLGIGSGIIDVEIEMEWVTSPSPAGSPTFVSSPLSRSTTQVPAAASAALSELEPPLRARTGDSQSSAEPEQSGLGAAVQVVLGGGEGEGEGVGEGVSLRQAVEAGQGAAD